MTTVSDDLAATTRKCKAALLSGIASMGLKRAGEILERDKSAVSRRRSGESAIEMTLDQCARLIVEGGYKVVPREFRQQPTLEWEEE